MSITTTTAPTNPVLPPPQNPPERACHVASSPKDFLKQIDLPKDFSTQIHIPDDRPPLSTTTNPPAIR